MLVEIHAVVQQAQCGDPTAFAALVREYQQSAQRVAQTVLGNREEGEDAVQEAWILALQAIPTLRKPERFGPWFYRIVANVALRKRQQRAIMGQHLPNIAQALEYQANLDDGQARSADYCALLPLALEALSAKAHTVINLHYFSHLPLESVARLLELPLGTVKSRLYHARQVLRKEILQMAKQSIPVHTPYDFRQRIAGMKGEILWQNIFAGDFAGWSEDRKPITPGIAPINWQAAGVKGLIGENAAAGSRLTYGEPTWQDLEFSLLVTPLQGGNAQVIFRVDEQNNRFYIVDLYLGWQAIGIRRVEPDKNGNFTDSKLSVVNYPLEHGREYALTLATIGHSITTYVDGALVNQVTDGSWLQGAIGLNIWHAKTLFRDVQIRFLQ